MDAELDDEQFDNDGHGHFRDLCLLYGDINRSVFLETIRERFVCRATDKELAELRESIALRAKTLKADRGKRGRPRVRSDEKLLIQVKMVAWRRHVEGWTWKQIAEADGLRPTKETYRTLERRRNSYAAVVWHAFLWALGGGDPSPERIKQALDSARVRYWLWLKAGLPFREKPQECKDLVEALVPFGRKASGEEFFRQIDYLNQRRTKKTPEPTVKKPV